MDAKYGNFKYAAHLLDTYVGTGLSELTVAAKPPALNDIQDSFSTWMSSQIFRARIVDDKLRILLSIFISRMATARQAYTDASEALTEYVTHLEETNAHTKFYRRAVADYETCVLHAYMAFSALNQATPNLNGPPLFVAKDGGDYDRLRQVSNRIKHFEEDISKGEHLNVRPMWLNDEGLITVNAKVTFAELANMLNDQGEDALYFSGKFFDDLLEHKKPK